MLFFQRFISTTTLFSLFAFLLIAFSVFFSSACSNKLTNQVKSWNPNDYTVKSGDSLYSIAWRYEIDPEQFSAWNNLSLSERLKAGQRLHTKKPANFDALNEAKRKKVEAARVSTSGIGVENNASKPVYLPAPGTSKGKRLTDDAATRSGDSNTAKWLIVRKGDSLYTISKRSNVKIARLAQLNQLKKPYTIQPGQTIYLKPLPSSFSKKTTKSKVADSGKKKESTKNKAKGMSWPINIRWVNPAQGKVIKAFSRKRGGSKGIDIAGKPGNTIVASADGKVVYSGNGLISYGNLIIIKHNKTYLSAYAYNRKLLVKEGVEVKAGQKIAEMGRKDKLSPRLHFEIRKNGKSVDPLKYIR